VAGKFIAFEGGEGGGKSTQAARLVHRLNEAGIETVQTREPGGTPLGSAIRSLLLSTDNVGMDPRAEALLYAADRAHHVGTVVLPALERGAWVITDRYIDSSLAYQGAGRGHDPAKIVELSMWAARGLMPDLTVVLDIDPSAGLGRAGRRAALDRFELEGDAFHVAVRDAFLRFAAAAPDRYAVIDASGTQDAVAEAVTAAVRPLVDANSPTSAHSYGLTGPRG
jgi:dTMP kinase